MKKNEWLLMSLCLLALSLFMCSKDQSKGIEFVFVAGGTYDMGDIFGNRFNSEKPVHSVTVSDFYMGKTEVTNSEYAAFLNEYGKDTDDKGNTMIYNYDWGIRKSGNRWQPQAGYENHPVIVVTWYGAMQYAKWAGCRLPTEAEWEYASREGGKKVKWSGTNTESLLGEYAWYKDNSGDKTHSVGIKKQNALGLYDMSGNVCEWCADWYDENYYQRSRDKDPIGSVTGDSRVLRGGSWFEYGWGCSTTYRSYSRPSSGDYYSGFRVVRDLPH